MSSVPSMIPTQESGWVSRAPLPVVPAELAPEYQGQVPQGLDWRGFHTSKSFALEQGFPQEGRARDGGLQIEK